MKTMLAFTFAACVASVLSSTCLETLARARQGIRMGAFFPRCKANGDWETFQLLDGGYNFCVSPDGHALTDAVQFGSCNCIAHRQRALKGGDPLPRCNQGEYEKIQCDDLDHCHCVDETTGKMLSDEIYVPHGPHGEPSCIRAQLIH